MRGLKEKRILITGGASGIGAATAARFLEEGSQVCILDRDAKACEAIRQQLPQISEAIIADVTNLMQVEAAFADAVRVMDGSRCPHQQCRHQHPPQLPRHHSRRVGQSHRRKSHRSLLRSPNRRPPHDGAFFVRARHGSDSANRFHQRHHGLSLLRRLQRHQSRSHRVDALHGPGTSAESARMRRSPRLRAHARCSAPNTPTLCSTK